MARSWEASAKGTNYKALEVDIRDIAIIVNYLDGIAIGMEQNLYIELIVKDQISEVFQHAVEIFGHKDIITPSGIRATAAVYNSWFKPSSTVYKSP